MRLVSLIRLVLALLSALWVSGLCADEANHPARDKVTFGLLQATSPEEAQQQALAWLKSTGKQDPATLFALASLWKENRPLLDRLGKTFELGDPEAAKLLHQARDPSAPPPTSLPAILKDAQRPAFFRANLALAYAKILSERRIYEEALDALKAVKVENTVDPSSYLFYKAVAEHALLLKKEADETILRLLDDVVDAPERHKMVAVLMHFDMRNWRDKDLGWIARKMNNIERRLDLSRGGPKTQKMQKEVVMRLDEIIKQLEKDCDCNGGNCPNGGNGSKPGANTRSSSPQQDSFGGTGSGPGNVDPKKLKEMAAQWGKLPERERAKAMAELTKDLPPRYREVIENYFKKLASSDSSR
jgi:tetratricopeptide (TPR) repeat protein